MFARSSLTLPPVVLVTLVALAAPAYFTSLSAASDLTHGSSRGVTATSTTTSRNAATQVADIQHRLTAVTGVTQPGDAAVDALARSLMTVRGREEDAASIASLAAVLAEVLGRGALAEYEIERFAQSLFAASSHVALPDHDAGLLAIDIAMLVQEATADTAAITKVLTALQQVCPAAKLPPSGIPPRKASRRLSVLSRQ